MAKEKAKAPKAGKKKVKTKAGKEEEEAEANPVPRAVPAGVEGHPSALGTRGELQRRAGGLRNSQDR